MQANTPHLLKSVSKSFVGMAAGIAVEDVAKQQFGPDAEDFAAAAGCAQDRSLELFCSTGMVSGSCC